MLPSRLRSPTPEAPVSGLSNASPEGPSRKAPAANAYIPGIDGLRAVAVLLVVLYHAKIAFPGGYIGVDVFFVISGYLITSIILRDLESGRFSLARFWERRVRRIFPALSAVVLATALAGYFLFLPNELRMLGKTMVAQTFMVANFFFLTQGNYFDGTLETNPLLHTWSLAVEEQFYLFFPVVLWALYRFGGIRWKSLVKAGIAAGFAVGLAGAVYLVERGALRSSFYLPPARVWELLCGSVLAILPAAMLPRTGRVRELLIGAGLTGIALPSLLYTIATPFPGLAAIPPCVGAAFVIYGLIGAPAGGKPLFLERLLTWKPMVFTGLVSYSLYLWHVPVLIYMEQYFFEGPLSPWEKAASMGLSFLLATLSWRFVETPFRKKLVTPKRSQIFAFGAVVSALAVTGGMLLNRSHGLPGRFPAKAAPLLEAANDRGIIVNTKLEDVEAGRFFPLGEKASASSREIFLWGDSHAMHLIPALNRIFSRHGLKGECAAHSNTAPLAHIVIPKTYGLNEKAPAVAEGIIAYIGEHHIKEVILAASWRGYLNSVEPKEFRRAFKETVHRLQSLGCTIVVVLSPAVQRADPPEFLLKEILTGRTAAAATYPYTTREQHYADLKGMYELVREMPGLHWMDLSPRLWDATSQRYEYLLNGRVIYRDKNHITQDAALNVYAPYIEKQMGSLLQVAR